MNPRASLAGRPMEVLLPVDGLPSFALATAGVSIVVVGAYLLMRSRSSTEPRSTSGANRATEANVPPEAPVGESAALNDLVRLLVAQWAADHFRPGGEVEAVDPRLAAAFSADSANFTFDSFREEPTAGWSWRELDLAEIHGEPISLFVPNEWTRVARDGKLAHLMDDSGTAHRTITTVDMAQWLEKLDGFFSGREVCGFAFDTLLQKADGFHRWVFVAGRSTCAHPYSVWALYIMGEVGLLTVGTAVDEEYLRQHLVSALISSPWRGTIARLESSDN